MELVPSGTGENGGGRAVVSASRSILDAQQAEACESVGLPPSYCLIDALPYADPADPGLLAAAKAMIEEEMQRGPRGPSVKLPGAATFDGERCPLFARGLEGGDGEDGLDTSRYGLEEPTGKDAKKAEAWLSGVENASAQLEHQALRLENLDLALKSGASVWRLANAQIEKEAEALRRETVAMEKDIEDLNRERKLQQFSLPLHGLERDWFGHVMKNKTIEAHLNNSM